MSELTSSPADVNYFDLFYKRFSFFSKFYHLVANFLPYLKAKRPLQYCFSYEHHSNSDELGNYSFQVT